MLTAMNDAVVRVMQSHEPSTLTIREGGEKGYTLSYEDPIYDPGSLQATGETLSRDLPITDVEAAVLIKQGAVYVGAPEKAPYV